MTGWPRLADTGCHAALMLSLIAATLVQVTAQSETVPPILTDDLRGWVADRTEASVESGVVTVKAGAGWLRSDKVFADYVLSMDARMVGAGPRAGIFVRTWPTFDTSRGIPNNGYRVSVGAAGMSQEAPGRVIAHGRTGQQDRYEPAAAVAVEDAAWRRYEIVCRGSTIRVSIDGAVVSEVSGVLNPQGHVAFRVETGALQLRNITLSGMKAPDPPPPEGAMDVKQVTTRPRVRRDVKPRYTAQALARRIQGPVWVSAIIQPDGTPSNLQILKSLDPEFGLDDEALQAAAQWRFHAASLDGRSVPVRVTIELHFILI